MNKLICIIFGVVLLTETSCKKNSTEEKDIDRQEEAGIFTNVGPQLTAVNLQESAFAQDAAGNEYAYSVVSGKPGHLVCFDMQANKIIADIEIPGANGSTAMVSTDNWLYIGGSNAHLYRTRPGSKNIEDLGLVLPSQ
ncbi:hypothetical protein EIM50_16890, partial [Pseudoxanthomonas sp. SGD-10]